MKYNALFVLCTFIFVLAPSYGLNAQSGSQKKANHSLEEEEEGPLMYKFEPNFLTSVEERREEIRKTRAALDTLDISDRKRKRLLKDLYKNGLSERLSKVLVAETKFEDEQEN